MSDTFLGYLDVCHEPRSLYGWAASLGQPGDGKLTIAMQVEGQVIGTAIASHYREDLRAYQDGNVAFELVTTADFSVQDFASGRAKLLALRDGRILGNVTLGTDCRRAIAAQHLKAALHHLHAGLDQLGSKGFADLLESPRSPLPESHGVLLNPFLESIENPHPDLFAERMDSDPAGALGAVARSVVTRFTSLGGNCEFGLVQRHFGAEPQDLFRWGTSSGQLAAINMGLGHRFSGVGQSMSLRVKGSEYLSYDNNYHYVFHTDRLVGFDDPDLLLRNEHKRVAYLARNLIEDLEEGKKIFVYKFIHEEYPDQIDGLLAGMGAIGDAALLWVSVARHPLQIGSVEKLRRNLFRGYIDRFSPNENIYEHCSYFIWLRILLETLHLRHLP